MVIEDIAYINRKPVPMDECSPINVLGGVVFAPDDCRGCSVLSSESARKARYINYDGGWLQLQLLDDSPETRMIPGSLPREYKEAAIDEANQRASLATSGQCRHIEPVGLDCWRNKTEPRGSKPYEHGRALAWAANKMYDRLSDTERQITTLNSAVQAMRGPNPPELLEEISYATPETRARRLEDELNDQLDIGHLQRDRFNRFVKRAGQEFRRAPEYAE